VLGDRAGITGATAMLADTIFSAESVDAALTDSAGALRR
jgi:hypothetical protein